MRCSCGNIVEKMTSYFDKKTNVRKTVCDNCAIEHGLKGNKNFYAVPTEILTAQQQIRPKP